MNNPQKWISRQARAGRIFLAAGALLFAGGLAAQFLAGDLPFDARILSGLGIFLLGLGISYLIRYQSARRDPQAAGRALREERDERNQMIRARAGNRAYWTSAALGYALLMWLGFASNGSLPALSEDALWYALAGVVVLPFVVFVASLVYDQQHS